MVWKYQCDDFRKVVDAIDTTFVTSEMIQRLNFTDVSLQTAGM